MKKLNPLKLKDFSWNDVEVVMQLTSYSNNNQLAILLYEKETGEYYCDLSVNVVDFPDENKYWDYIAVDVNNCPNAEEFIQRNQLWELVDYIQSWFVSYPIYRMYPNKLSYYNFDEYNEYMKLHWWWIRKKLSKDAPFENEEWIKTLRDRLK